MGQGAQDCRKLLLIEDEKDIREALREALEMEDYRVSTACNGQEAMEMLNKMEAPCVILLDLMMPVLDGWEFRRRQTLSPHSEIPVIVVSAAADKIATIDANEYIRKPIELDCLIKAIKKYCN
jgi:CheY-like chemotaxis protein